jgi:hypothetical protein
MKDLKVIHPKRNNLLKVCLSHSLAKINKKAIVRDYSCQPKYTKTELEYDYCLSEFEQSKKWEHEYDDFFYGHDKIEVIYEELLQEFLPETKRIQNFLGVKPRRLSASTLKQGQLSLSESILNYYELKEKFQGTPWIDFFEE